MGPRPITFLVPPLDKSLSSNGAYNKRFTTPGFLIAEQSSFVCFTVDPIIISAGSQLFLQVAQAPLTDLMMFFRIETNSSTTSSLEKQASLLPLYDEFVNMQSSFQVASFPVT